MDLKCYGAVDEARMALFNLCIVRKGLIAARDSAEGDEKTRLRYAMKHMDKVVKSLQLVFETIAEEQLNGQYDIGFDDAERDWVDGGNDETEFDAEDYNDLAALWLDFCGENGFDPFSVQRVERVGDFAQDDE